MHIFPVFCCMRNIYNKVKANHYLDYYLALFVASIVLIKRLLISRYGINWESPMELENIFLVLDGQLIYRDFFWYHGFFPIYWHALIFKILSPEIYYLRLFVTLFAAVTSFFAYRITRFFLSPWLSVCVSLLGFTGLVVSEHTTGEMMAFCCITVSFYFLLQYCNTSQPRSLFFAGLMGGISTLAQILHLGLFALIGGVIAIFCYGLFGERGYWKNFNIFILGYIPLPLLCYGLLAIFVSPRKLMDNLFPDFASNHASSGASTTFSYPSLIPTIGFGQSLPELISNFNKYLFINLRWWLIVLVFVLGLIEFLLSWKNKKLSKNGLLLFGTLVLYGPLFEAKALLIAAPAGKMSTYINMLPTYVLLFYLLKQVYGFKLFTPVLAVGFLLIYFFYPFGKYYYYFSKNAVALNMTHSKWISVSPYKYDLYHKTVDYIKSNTQEGDTIVMSGLNHYFSIFSNRYDVFRNQSTIFWQTSFNPVNKAMGPSTSHAYEAENKIINKIEQANAKLILMPDGYSNAEPKKSPYLSYLDSQWEKAVRIGDYSLLNPYDYEPAIFIYNRK